MGKKLEQSMLTRKMSFKGCVIMEQSSSFSLTEHGRKGPMNLTMDEMVQ